MATKKEKVTNGLAPDLFEALADDDEQDNDAVEEVSEAVEEEEEEEEEKEPAETQDGGDSEEPPEPQVPEELEKSEPTDEVLPPKPADPPGAKRVPTDDGTNGEPSYVVQRGFTATGGKTYHPGDTIPVKCMHCALWEKEWLGKVRCKAGHVLVDDTVMAADKFSCGAFFICKEFDPELNTFLGMSIEENLVVRQMITGMKTLLGVERWLDKWADKHTYDGDKQALITNARGFIMSFSSLEQLTLAEPYLRHYTQMRAKKERDKRPPRPKFESGDWVEWTDLSNGERVSGIILSKSHGKIFLAGLNVHSGQKFTFKYKEWKKTREPKIVRKTAGTDEG
jgi:hypothetical protein